MTHELKKIIETAAAARQQGHKSVLATVVDLDGSSYRRPGVRMLLLENGKMTGAVSGGCVEKDIQRQAEAVFVTGKSRIMTYDGRYRLGCEGILYILLEPFNPGEELLDTFAESMKTRQSFEMISFYEKKEGVNPDMGSFIKFSEGHIFPVSGGSESPGDKQRELKPFVQQLKSCFKLLILGAEHDAVQLCAMAAMAGWEVTVVTTPSDPKTRENFPGAAQVLALASEALSALSIDRQTAVMVMSHSFTTDLKYIIALQEQHPAYLGLLGPAKRRERLMAELMEHNPDLDVGFPASVHGPAGLNVGAETPQEIAVSVIAEILSVVRNQDPIPLRTKKTGIHT